MANRVVHFEIQADDPARAKKFYEDTFDWKIDKYMSAADSPMDYWMVITGSEDTPGINGGIYPRPAEGKLNTYDCTIMVDDLDKAVDTVKANGGVIKRAKEELKGVGFFARIADPEGNLVSLMQATEMTMEDKKSKDR